LEILFRVAMKKLFSSIALQLIRDFIIVKVSKRKAMAISRLGTVAFLK
jgi:hypothetical protein